MWDVKGIIKGEGSIGRGSEHRYLALCVKIKGKLHFSMAPPDNPVGAWRECGTGYRVADFLIYVAYTRREIVLKPGGHPSISPLRNINSMLTTVCITVQNLDIF